VRGFGPLSVVWFYTPVLRGGNDVKQSAHGKVVKGNIVLAVYAWFEVEAGIR
jgi:hypothetical protein